MARLRIRTAMEPKIAEPGPANVKKHLRHMLDRLNAKLRDKAGSLEER
jgi:hypothetical protein